MNGETTEKIYHFLSSAPLFNGLQEDTLKQLSRSCRVRRDPEGRALFLQHDPADAAFIVSSGRVEIVLASADGRQIVINEMHPGDCFGELGLVTGETRSADAITGEATELIVIPREAFLKALEADPRLAHRLLHTTALRLRSSSEFESSLAFLDIQSRLARLLLDMDQARGGQGPIFISQAELADRTGTIRQTVAKALGQWRRVGWLSTGRGKIQLLNRRAIETWLKARREERD